MRDPFSPMTQGEIDSVSAWVRKQRLRRDVNNAVGEVVSNAANFPRSVQARLLGQDIGPLREKITDAVMEALETKEES